MSMKRHVLIAVFCLLVVGRTAWSDEPATAPRPPALQLQRTSPVESICFAEETRSAPRPLAILRLTVDLQRQDIELAVAAGEDPDGDGPVEAKLTSPVALAQRERFLAAVNTNPWTMVPPPRAGEGPNYVAGADCDVAGWLQSDVKTCSPPQAGHWSFWIDAAGRGHIGDVDQMADSHCAVSGFGGLLRDGQVLPQSNDVLHPRTALGLDRDGRLLTLLVVDGRQPGYSEGVSLLELAGLMQQAGCWNALNLDGGGSTIMLLGEAPEQLRIMNRPCDKNGPRPVPVVLGIRRKEGTGDR
jgi:hypothetical protein